MADTASDDVDLTHYLDILLRRRWIIIASAATVFAATALVTFTMRPVYQASAMLVIEKERGGGIVQSGSMVENSNEDYYQTQYKLLQSRSLLAKVHADLGLDKTEEFGGPRGVEELGKAISISPVMRSRLVYVKAASLDKSLAAAIANRLSEAFVDQNVANQLFISKEVLQALQMKEGRSSYDSLPAVVNNPLIQSLKGDYAKLQSSYAELSQRYTEKHPLVAQVKSNMLALDAQIKGETERIVASLKTELSGQLKGNNVRVIDPALVPEKPVKPRKAQNLAFGLLGGVALGLALALFIDVLDRSVRTQLDVEDKLGQPFLGLVPQSAQPAEEGAKSYAALIAKEQSLTSEAFRNLRTMVDFAGVGGKAKAFLVTSTVQGEGKTYIAANLAVAAAQLGESVLLIDGDLRRPNVHRSFGVPSQRGLSDYLAAGRHAEDAAEHIIKCEDVPGLAILPCGPRPPNPSELLNTPRVGALVAWARENYDRVIIDCTPMFPINDTLLWARHVPAAVFVVRYGKTRVPFVLEACRKFQNSGAKGLGVAVNAAQQGGLSYAAYGYYYHYYAHEYAETPSRSS